jgi:thiol:disulfide interchange protein DsbD
MTRALAALFLLFFAAAPAFAQVDSAPKVHAQLFAEHDTIAPGGTVTVALEEVIREGWHTYWLNPGDAGAPTNIKWSLPPGWSAGPIQWPYPQRLPVTPLMDYGYENKVWLLTDIRAPADAKPGDALFLKATADWLVCKEVCIPEEVALQIPVEIGTANAPDPDTAAQFAATRAKLPMPSPWPVVFHAGANLDLFLKSPQLAAAHPVSADFFPATEGLIQNPAPQQMGFASNGLVLRLAPQPKAKTASALDGVVVLTSADGSAQAIAVHATPGVVPPAEFTAAPGEPSLLFALLFAFLGGIILNVMPCVLPVLAIKMLALADQSGAEKSAARREGFAYGFGAILSFVAFGLLIVVLRAGGEQIGWGFQLQEPIVVAGLALLLFAVGLSLSGIFAFPTISFGGDFAQRGGVVGAFFTGVLAVAVAAPCTAPFMAAALGFALTQSAWLALGVFFALGLGFALPFLLIAIWPAALRILPKPGAWMLRLERILALPMYGAALWLLWVLSQQTSTRGLALTVGAMIVVALGAFVFTRTRDLDNRRRGMGNITALVALLLALSALWTVRGEQPALASNGTADVSGIPAESYSAARLAQYRLEHRPIFLNATAAWCVTCLVNERAVLSQSAIHEALKKNNVAYIVADWTRRDPAITALLDKYQRPGVPLYLYFAPGKEAQILPQVLTEAGLLAAIEGQSTP